MRTYTLGVCTLLLLFSCGKKSNETTKESETTTESSSFSAVPMPSTLINGDAFPTDSNTINTWVASSSSTNNLETNTDIINHGWAIWAALTEMTDQTDSGDTLRRFETWYTPQDIIDASNAAKAEGGNNLGLSGVQRRNRGMLKRPNQFDHAARLKNIPVDPSQESILGFVKYDPSAANHAYDNKLFYASTLEAMLKTDKIVNIPNFPTSGVTLKPVFQTLTNPDANGLYKVASWPGDGGNVNRPFGSGAWNNYIYITTTGSTDVANNIYAVDEFINFQLDAAQAAAVKGAQEGSYSVLLAMHVTTREITRWTWQTFWWSKNVDAPFSPSSNDIAGLRPTGNLDKGANHYAMAIAYNNVTPAQPENGGSGANATSLYAYNPYLEAGFDSSTFTLGNSFVKQAYPNDPNYQKVGGEMNMYGMQTNCMSCHGQARYKSGYTSNDADIYLTDQYFELNAPYFENSVKLDFAWSILGNLINDDGTPKK